MKKLSILILSAFLIFTACEKETTEPDNSNTTQNDDDNGGSSQDTTANVQEGDFLWVYDTGVPLSISSLLVMDENDNSYFVNKEENYNKYIYSINKNGQLNWKIKIDDNTSHDLMYVNGKIYYLSGPTSTTVEPRKLRCINASTGTIIWTKDVEYAYQMAYSNNTIYLLSAIDNYNSKIFSINPSTGTINWYSNLNGVTDVSLRTNGNHLCITAETYHTTENQEDKYYNAVFMYSDNGSGMTKDWEWLTPDSTGDRYIPYSIFDGNGNVYYADFTGSSTKVRCFDEASGNVKWVTPVSSVSSFRSNIYCVNNKVYITYYDHHWTDWVNTNSIAVLNATDGTIISQNDGLLGEEMPTDVYITGDNNFIDYKYENGYNIRIHSETGTEIKKYTVDYISCHDIKITSEGNIVVLSDDNGKLYCIKSNMVQPTGNDWAYYDGNAANTNGIN